MLEKGGLKERESAAIALSKLADAGLGIEQGKFALKAAARKFPPRKYHFYDSSRDLVSAAAKCPRPEYIPIILELYPTYNEEAKVESLWLLSEMQERSAAVAYMQIVNSFAREGAVPRLVTGNLELKPRHPHVFFPNLLKYARIPNFEQSVYYLFLCYLQKYLIKTDDSSIYLGSLVSSYKKYEKKLMPAQQNSGVAWMWKDRYREWRSKAALLLDILGYFPAADVEEPLRSALDYRDPRLKLFGVTSLIRQGKKVAAKHMLDIASSPEVRNYFYDELGRLGAHTLYPKKYKNQKAFAESDMVRWLVYPTELGTAPDEIELMKIITVDAKGKIGPIDYFIYRFRVQKPHWGAKRGWLAGVSGPFIRKDGPSTNSLGETFSSFDQWDSKTPEEHLGDIQEIIDNWARYSATKS